MRAELKVATLADMAGSFGCAAPVGFFDDMRDWFAGRAAARRPGIANKEQT